MIDSYWSMYIVLFFIIVFVSLLAYMFSKGYSKGEIKDKAIDIFSKHKKLILGIASGVVALAVIVGVSVSSAKKQAVREIQTKIEIALDNFCKEDSAVKFGVKNIEVSVDNIDKYLEDYHAYITIHCDAENVKYDSDIDSICTNIMFSLPDSVNTSSYGSVKIKNIIYKPENETYGVSIFVNGEQFFKHGKSFSDLAKEQKWLSEYEREKEFESKYYAYSEYYEVKNNLKNNW